MTEKAELRELQDLLTEFAARRGWDRVRTLKDLSLAVGIEVAELQELLLWVDASQEEAVLEQRHDELEAELADIFIYLLALADRAGVDLLQAARAKMAVNERRFPAQDS